MGSATFALPSLNSIFEAGHTVTGVITQPDKPSGRGQVLQGPPVKKRAYDLHLPTYQPASLKTDEARQLFDALAPELVVVVAYGKILPPWLLRLPKYGCINLHGSLLPRYRGAAPVHWAVANGEDKTGVCTMLLDEGLDTGPVYLSEETPIGPDETVTHLYDRLAVMGGPLVVRTIEGIVDGNLKATPQDDARATLAPILKKKDGFLDWTWSSGQIHNRVRALNPWPGTVAGFRDRVYKILATAIGSSGSEGNAEPGRLMASKGRLLVTCGDRLPIEILKIQPENKNAISGKDFVNGARIQPGEKFETVKDNGPDVRT
jgi:methionyl-tRNA formyltransferase